MKDDALIIAGIAIVGIFIVSKVIGGLSDLGNAAQTAAADAANAINPLNPDNIIAGGVNSVLQGVTGSQDQTLGTWLFDVFN